MKELANLLIEIINNSGIYGMILNNILILIESIFPILPVMAFITIDCILFGKIFGLLISWVLVIIGCIVSYMIFKYGFGNKFERLTENKELVKKYTTLFKKISTGKLLLIVAFPFTPAFMVNIAAGSVKMDFKKYLVAIIIGKISLVIYSAYVGISLIDSITNPLLLLNILVIVSCVYLLYRIVNKIFKLE